MAYDTKGVLTQTEISAFAGSCCTFAVGRLTTLGCDKSYVCKNWDKGTRPMMIQKWFFMRICADIFI